MITEHKVTKILCIANDFCKVFDAQMEIHHKKAMCFFHKKPTIAVQRTIDRQLTLF